MYLDCRNRPGLRQRNYNTIVISLDYVQERIYDDMKEYETLFRGGYREGVWMIAPPVIWREKVPEGKFFLNPNFLASFLFTIKK